MKSDKFFLDATDEKAPTVVTNPTLNSVVGSYDIATRFSLSSNNTFATTTTRASSVMPQAKPNLGLTESVTGEMNEEEVYSYYGKTEVGKKNALATGTLMLSKPQADLLNADVKKAQNIEIQANIWREGQEKQKQVEGKRKQ